MTDCVVLVSLGSNPATGRLRLAPDEAAAITLAVRCGLAPRLLHAGPRDVGSMDAISVLRRGLGLGARALDFLVMDPHADPLPALVDHLAKARPSLVLCGKTAETGEGSGMIPFRVGRALQKPVIADCLDIVREDHTWVARTRAGSGLRHLFRLPPDGAVVTLAEGALRAPLGSRFIADCGDVSIQMAAAPPDPRHGTEARPARRLPPPIMAPDTARATSQEPVLTDATAGAKAILALIRATGLRGDS